MSDIHAIDHHAVLQPIVIEPIKVPTYRNERIRSFADWFRDNDKAITAYYNTLRPVCEGEPLVDYWTFAAIQHEREEIKLMTERLPHGAGKL